jgi:hypothetical protein
LDHGEETAVFACPECDYLTDAGVDLREHVGAVHRPMTSEAVMRVANEAADRVISEMEWDGGTREQDAINLVVNMLGTLLEHPDVTADEVMDENYDGGADAVRSWWPEWARSAAR